MSKPLAAASIDPSLLDLEHLSQHPATTKGPAVAAQEQPGSLALLTALLPGAIGGISLVLVGHPFDLLKVRMQALPNSSLRSCLQSIISNPKGIIRGLYQGVTPPLIGVIPIFALYYGVYTQARRSSLGIEASAVVAACTTALIGCPAERIKILLQLAPSYQNTSLRGVQSLVREMLASREGLRAFYKGFGIMIAREVPSSIVYFSVYERLKGVLSAAGGADSSGNSSSSNILSITLAGGIAGMCSWLATAPLDTLKSIIQAEGLRPAEHAHSPGSSTGTPATGEGNAKGQAGAHKPRRVTARTLARQIYAANGIKGFYKGASPALMRAFPANAACFGGIEVAQWIIERLGR